MPEPLTYYLPNMMMLFCIGIDRFRLAETLPRHSADIVVPDITRLGDRR